jgi:uncharacterized damage-inducible protein DinB
MIQGSLPDTRVDPPANGSERDLLISFLDLYRETVLLKVSGLSEEQLRRRLVPSATTLLGIVKHLGYVERSWFRMRLNGEDLSVPWTEQDPDADFRIEPDETAESVFAFYREQIERARAIVAKAQLDDRVKGKAKQPYTLRWILIHMIEETARHAGHADILREQTDGAAGE